MFENFKEKEDEMNEERNTNHGFVNLVSLKGLSVPKLQISKLLKEREYIRSGAGVKQLFLATNNNAPRLPIILNLIHLITHDYNPQNIPRLKRIFLSDPSHLFCSLPLIKTQRRSTRASQIKAFKLYIPDLDISFVSNGRLSTYCMFPSFFDNI